MADYGHELEFGTFVTPLNERPQDVVALAQLTERVGLDLVTFQDHPYQPGFLDTWTLLSYVAAKTERVHLSGNVLNLPLRNPAVLARAATGSSTRLPPQPAVTRARSAGCSTSHPSSQPSTSCCRSCTSTASAPS